VDGELEGTETIHLLTVPVDTCQDCGTVLDNQGLGGVELSGVYDGVLFWCCNGCGRAFERFPPGHQLHSVAAGHISKWNEQKPNPVCSWDAKE
jgi:hypothetical protein